MIIAVFAVLTGGVGWIFHLYDIDHSYSVKTDVAIIIITVFAFVLLGVSYFRAISNRPLLLSYLFKVSVSSWFIVLTALNDFPADYSYCMILVVMMFGMVYSDLKGFVIFFLSTCTILVALAFYVAHPIIHLGTFLLIYGASGILMYLILRSRERTQTELLKAQINAQAILQSSEGFFFFLDGDFNIISFNQFAKEIYRKDMHVDLEEGKSIFQYMLPETHESLRSTLYLCKKGEVIKNERKINFPGWPSMWVENIFIPIYDDDKKFLGISFHTISINKRKEMEEALKESEERFKEMADTLPLLRYRKPNANCSWYT